jgi:hypothetical protein
MSTIYDFTAIAITGDLFEEFVEAPAINADGTVAWSALLEGQGAGIFTGSGGDPDPVATTESTEPNYQGFGFPTINDSGSVAFYAQRGRGLDSFLPQGGQAGIFRDSDLTSSPA